MTNLGVFSTILKQNASLLNEKQNISKEERISLGQKQEESIAGSVIWLQKCLIRYEFISVRQTVNKELYVEIRRRLWDAIRCKHPEKMGKKQHCTLDPNYLVKNSVTTLEHSPYSPDIAQTSSSSLPENIVEGTINSRCWDCQTNCDNMIKRTVTKWVPKCFKQM